MPSSALQVRGDASSTATPVPVPNQTSSIQSNKRQAAPARRSHLRLATMPVVPARAENQDQAATADRAVIHLSLGDTRRSLRPQTIGSDIMRAIFGVRPTNGFADPRLEALRVYAVTYRTEQGRHDATNVAAAVAAGLEPAILKEARRIIDARAARRERRPRHTAQLVTMLLVAALGVLAQHRLAQELDDQLVASVLAGVMAVVVLSVVGRSPRTT